jgi:hypothetical protein
MIFLFLFLSCACVRRYYLMWKRRVAVVAQVDALQQLFPTAARVAEEEKEKKK